LALYSEQEIQLYSHLELLARQAVAGFITGLHKSPYHGFSVEFAEHRQYNQGESIRHIDWKLFGRTDKLFVKRFEEETNLRCHIVLDNSSSMYFPFDESKPFVSKSKTNYGLFAAAVIIYLLKLQRDAFGLTVFSDEIEFFSGARSTSQHHQFLMNTLDNISKQTCTDKRKPTAVASTLHQIAERIHKRSLVVVISDMFDGYNSSSQIIDALQHLRHNKHEIIVFHVTDKQKEFELDYDNRPHKFIDMETGDELVLNPNDIRKEYKEYIQNVFLDITKKCSAHRIDVVELDINSPPERILKPYLTKRKKMF